MREQFEHLEDLGLGYPPADETGVSLLVGLPAHTPTSLLTERTLNDDQPRFSRRFAYADHP